MAKIYKPSALLAFLEEHGLSAKKRFSQNFLIDYNILKKIVSAAHIQEGDLVLEIGAGPGALTEMLLEAKANVIAIELDKDFARVLNRLQDSQHSLEIFEGDALKIDLEELCKQKARHKKIKVVANLPYHITTPILTRLLPMHHWVESLTVMVQKEFAERMAGKAGTSSYSSFTLFVQYYSTAKFLFTISPSCFFPAPKVHSAIVHCALHSPALKEAEEKHFFTMTRTAFGQRRKMLRSTLKNLYPAQCIDAALEKMGLSLKVRPEELSLSQFITLFHFLSSTVHDKSTR